MSYDGRTDDDLRAEGRMRVERIAELLDVPGVAQDEVAYHRSEARALLDELKRRAAKDGGGR